MCKNAYTVGSALENFQIDGRCNSSELIEWEYQLVEVDMPVDPVEEKIDEKKREELTKEYLKKLDQSIENNIIKIKEYNNNNATDHSKLILPNRIQDIWTTKDSHLYSDMLILPPCVLHRGVVDAYLNRLYSDNNSGYERLKYILPEYALILGNAIGKFENTYKKHITTPGHTQKLLLNNYKIILQSNTDELWEFINTLVDNDVSQLSSIIRPNENAI